MSSSSKVTAGPVRKGSPVVGTVSTKTAVTVKVWILDQSGAQMVVSGSLSLFCPLFLVHLYCWLVVSVIGVSVTKHRGLVHKRGGYGQHK